MKVAVLVVVLASGCRADGTDDSYPVLPGGGGPIASGGGGGGTGDAGAGDGGTDDAGLSLSGRVCVLEDLTRIGDRAACATTGAAALTVTLGTRSATTSADGSFRIAAPAGGGLVWRVTDRTGAIVTSVVPFGTDPTLPAVSEATYSDLLSGNGIVLVDQQGSVVVRVVSASGGPVSGATGALPAGATANETRYDTASRGTFSTTQTGAAGIVWFPGIELATTPPTLVPVSLSLGATSLTETLPVENQAITFATMELP